MIAGMSSGRASRNSYNGCIPLPPVPFQRRDPTTKTSARPGHDVYQAIYLAGTDVSIGYIHAITSACTSTARRKFAPVCL
jgi:hypothetical protein